MSTIAMNHVMAMDNGNINKKAGFVEEIKKYLLDNAALFAASSAMMSGNGYQAAQIMRDAKRQ